MEEDDQVVIAGIDASESIIVSHKLDLQDLRDENQVLKRNLQINIDKLNDALKVVDNMQ